MGKIKDQTLDRLARYAIEDFGTAEVPIELRRQARVEAARQEISPKEALDRIRAREASKDGPKRHALVEKKSRGRRKSGKEGAVSKKNTAIGKRPIRQLQQEAMARGRKWIKGRCTRCPAEVLIHVEWQDPLVLCKGCRARRETQLRAVNYVSKALRPRMPTEGWSVRGGLPSLGKRPVILRLCWHRRPDRVAKSDYRSGISAPMAPALRPGSR